jgi:PKD repeat protein
MYPVIFPFQQRIRQSFPVLFLVASVSMPGPCVLARDAHFSWLANTGDDTSGYTIHYGTSSGTYAYTRRFDNPTPVHGRIYATISGLNDQTTYYFAATAHAADSTVSGYSSEIRLNGLILPTAAFSSSIDSDNGLRVLVNGSSSSGSPTSYSWDFGDGGSATGATAAHTYSQAGAYTIVLTVSNNDGSDIISHSLTLSEDATTNHQPTVAFTTSTTSGPVPLQVSFDGTISSDPDQDTLQYTWNFGDGLATASTAKASHTYTTPGTYTVSLSVNDGRGGISDITRTIVCLSVNDETPTGTEATTPTAYITTTKHSLSKDPGNPLLDISLDGTQSTGSSSGEDIVQYAWNLGDGSTATGAKLRYQYHEFGTYFITLTVTDSSGKQAVARQELLLAKEFAQPDALLSVYHVLLLNHDTD